MCRLCFSVRNWIAVPAAIGSNPEEKSCSREHTFSSVVWWTGWQWYSKSVKQNKLIFTIEERKLYLFSQIMKPLFWQADTQCCQDRWWRLGNWGILVFEEQVDYLNHSVNCLVCKACPERLNFALFLLFGSKNSPEMLGQECGGLWALGSVRLKTW